MYMLSDDSKKQMAWTNLAFAGCACDNPTMPGPSQSQAQPKEAKAF